METSFGDSQESPGDMGDYDSSPMLYCSGVFSHKIPFASKGLGYQSQQPSIDL